MLKLARSFFITLLITGFSLPSAALADAVDAESFVNELSETVISVLSDDKSSEEQKLTALVGLMEDSANLELMGKLILGKHWKTAAPDEQTRYLDLFRNLVNKTLAERMSYFSGQTVEITGSKKVTKRDYLVNSLIIKEGGPTYEVDYRVREDNEGLAIIDVIAEGISMVVTQRNEIGQIVSANGMEGLINVLQKRLEESQQQ